MIKDIVTLECLVDQTLVKDESGQKVRVKEGETFTTSTKTAEVYLRVYSKNFKLVEGEGEAPTGVDVIGLQNTIQTQEAEIRRLTEVNGKLEDNIKERDLADLRAKYDGVDLKDIPYNDLKKIASIKGITFDKNPKTAELIKALEDDEAGNTAKEETNKEAKKGEK